MTRTEQLMAGFDEAMARGDDLSNYPSLRGKTREQVKAASEKYERYKAYGGFETINAARPIDTAPRDGSEFLAYDPVSRKFDVCEVATWGSKRENSSGWYIRSTQGDGEDGPLHDDFQPERASLWWPLPQVE